MSFPLQECQKALDRAKIALMSKPDSVFFCDLAFGFKYVWDETIPTAAVDGVSIFLNPEFFMKQTPDQRVGLILHETLHPVYMHLSRKGNRDHNKWNIAGDHVINLTLTERGIKIPHGGYCDRQYIGMTTEQVYDALPKETPPDFEPDIMDPAMDPDILEDQIEQNIIRAAIRSQQEGDQPGTIPGDIQVFLDGLLKPKLPWNRLLMKYLQVFNKNDYSFRKPNRRHFPEHYLPSLYSESLMDLVIAVDISGSVTDTEFKQFISEVASIFRMMKPKNIKLIQFDTQIKSIESLEGFSDLMKVQFKGRGGTDVSPVIDWINSNKPQLTLVFTDGEFRFKGDGTKKEIIWLIHNNARFTAPYGKTIHYEITSK